MPLYEYRCKCSDDIIEKICKTYTPSKYITCPKCGSLAKKIVSLPNTDLVNNERISRSMGVNIKQIPEAMKAYPGSEYDAKGNLKIKNRKHKLFEMKRRNLVEIE